ncbi:MAG: DoxX family protein [Parachlamydiaceae bacterium]|nr:DoxX family protein [Parachlamydiaceae bacterium]
MYWICSFGVLLGRLCLSAIFILAGIGKLMDYEGTMQYMKAKGFTLIPLFLISAALLEIIAGLLLVIGFKTRWAATLLILFLIPTTIIFHDFWTSDPSMYQTKLNDFFRNVAIIGGLLYVLCSGAGKCSFDVCCCKTKP